MNLLYQELQWLPKAPQDFSAKTRALGDSAAPIGAEVQALATHALDLNQLTRLAKAIGKARSNDASLSPLVHFRLAVLSNSTIDLLVPALIASAARHGIALEVIQPAFDQVVQEALTADSQINSARPDAVLLALDYKALPLQLSLGDSATSATQVQSAMSYLKMLRTGIKTHCGAVCIFQTLAPPPERLFGNLDRIVHGTWHQLIASINNELTTYIGASGDLLLDVAGLAETVGLANWHDPKLWNLGKFAFSDDLIPLYAEHVSRLLNALLGRSKKVLVLDLDNTLWGGVIGDDGIEGIKLSQGDASGEAHRAVQRMALELRSRGIVLAVSSKNNDAIARQPFVDHPEMLLRMEHIAVFQANWNDKATNIRAIAEELSLGLDSIVFLDDNPVERALVRQMLPEVGVPELPDDPALYARTLAAAGYFDSIAFAAEDLQRAGFYADNAKRVELKGQIGDLDEYLASLNMKLEFRPFDDIGRARITQLINKSNQYNLTTRRYTEPQVAEAEADPNVFTLQVRLTDVFGDNGMISVVICHMKEAGVWEINTWLMSCRVLGRKVEQMVLRELVIHARRHNIDKLVGVYLPSGRNELVKDHYRKLGFTKVECSSSQSGQSCWELFTDGAHIEAAPIQTFHFGFDFVPLDTL